MVNYICAMQKLVESISSLYRKWKGQDAKSIDLLPQSGSERRYFRLHGEEGTVIGTYGANIPENETFIYFSRQFKATVGISPVAYRKLHHKLLHAPDH